MPLPESSQSKMTNCPSELTFMHDEFAEFLWDNVPVMQGQSNRPRKSSIFTALPPCGGRVSENDGRDNPYPKIGHFRATESKLNSFPGFGINARDDDDVDDIGPWINYPMEDPLHNDHCSEFSNDYAGVTVNSVHSQTIAGPAIRSSFLEQVGRDSRNVEQGHAMETSRIRPGQPCQLPTQFHSSVPSAKSSEMELGIGNSSKAHRESGGNGLLNFGHFSRPVALTRANLQGVDRSAGNKNKENFAMSSNPMKTTVIESTSGLKSVLGTQDQVSSVQPNRDLIPLPKPPQEVIFVDKAICEGENSSKNSNPNHTNTCNGSPERIQSSSFAVSVALGRHETEKGSEAAVASPSACSDSSSGPVSNDHKQGGKRKHQEGEESGYQSEDLEEESMELKKSSTAQGKSKKRSRAAEVHNLSERRRRDRINERMRALQELVPNCNKTDKASMLDEAIEYLKSLQMQVQMMSMGSGFRMPPVMMQHMRAPTMAHFSPMGIGMGMGIGLSYGMGMCDMNGSPGCSFIPVSTIHGPQFPCPSIPGPQGLHRVPGSNSLQMFGIPGQGLPVPVPYHPPPASLTDTKISTVAATKSENHLESKGLKKTEIKY